MRKPFLTLSATLLSVFWIALTVFQTSALAYDGFGRSAKSVDRLKTESKTLLQRHEDMKRKKAKSLIEAKRISSQILNNQRKLDTAQKHLKVNQNRLVETQVRIQQMESTIDTIRSEAGALSGQASHRLRQIYMGGRINALQMIIQSKDLSTLIDRLHYRQLLVTHDRQLLGRLNDRTQRLRQQQELLLRKKSDIGRTIENMEDLQYTISSRLENDKRLRDRYWQDAKVYEAAEKQLIEESRKLESEIMRITTSAQQQSVLIRSSGRFAWPLSGPITSGYGYRRHPIHRKTLMHTGLDISRPRGTAITAADSGMVIFSGWRGGYGKVVMINHGSHHGENLVSLYAHLSRSAVRAGQSVNKGETIAYVGSTGYSTGPHLHFEIRENGQTVNPLKHLR